MRLPVGMFGQQGEQVFFENLQFAQGAVGGNDADAVVGAGASVG